MENLTDLQALSNAWQQTEKMPLLFLGHGSPMNAIEENEFVSGWRAVAKSLPQPQAILCISAHWYTKGTKVTAMQMPRTIHDFQGFPQALFQTQYPAKGSPHLAQVTQQLLQPSLVELDEKWGLDHGAWSVLRHLYPQANVPVIQLSIDYSQGPEYHFNLSQQLKILRHKGVLIVGSGNIIHNLSLVDFKNFHKDNYGFDWAHEAHEILNAYLLNGNDEALMHYHKLNNAVRLAIPSPDHYLPLIYCLGFKEKGDTLSLFNDKLIGGSLSMTSIKIA